MPARPHMYPSLQSSAPALYTAGVDCSYRGPALDSHPRLAVAVRRAGGIRRALLMRMARRGTPRRDHRRTTRHLGRQASPRRATQSPRSFEPPGGALTVWGGSRRPTGARVIKYLRAGDSVRLSRPWCPVERTSVPITEHDQRGRPRPAAVARPLPSTLDPARPAARPQAGRVTHGPSLLRRDPRSAVSLRASQRREATTARPGPTGLALAILGPDDRRFCRLARRAGRSSGLLGHARPSPRPRSASRELVVEGCLSRWIGRVPMPGLCVSLPLELSLRLCLASAGAARPRRVARRSRFR
jgi:hypothetical protein